MLKQLFLLFNFVSFSFITFILNDDLKVSTNLPNELKQDSTYVVEVVIDKGDIIGFAKFQQNLPEGFNVEPIEVADASFTYAEGKVKFIWMAIPESPQVTISYKITATSEAPASGLSEGKFSYIDEMERKSYDLPNQTLTVLKPEDAPIKVEAMAEIIRTVQATGGNEYEVTLQISKQGIEGFSKIEELLPDGASAEVMENKLSVFSQVSNKAKFVWMSIPNDEFLEVAYKVTLDGSDALQKLQSMEGSLSFLDESETKTVPVIGIEGGGELAPAEEMVASTESEEVVMDTAKAEPEEAVVEAEPIQQEEEKPTEEVPAEAALLASGTEEKEPAKTEPVQAKEEPTIASVDETVEETNNDITRVPAPQTGVMYKVQIIAGHKLVDEKHIAKTYNFKSKYEVENHEGWIKYVTGGFGEYKQARDQRESLVTQGHNFPGPFVTAYNQGERITVQEALMITNQQWVK